MGSPSAQLIPQTEDSILRFDDDADGPSSSPFVTQVDSRIMSKQWDTPTKNNENTQNTMDIFATPATFQSKQSAVDEMMDDKENVPEGITNTTKKLVFSPQKRPITPPSLSVEPTSSPATEKRRDSKDSDLMPPPSSTRKTPRRAPSHSTNTVDSTPRPSTSRHNISHSAEELFETHSTYKSSASVSRTSSYRNSSDTVETHDTNVDDTCFSTFSEVPEMTVFARLGQSPMKGGGMTPARNAEVTPRTSRKRSSPSRSPSPTPRRQKTPANHDGTTFLIDFTQQMENVGGFRYAPPSKSSTQPDLLKYMNEQRSPYKSTRQSYATPSKPNNLLNLLDFELPPAPTPRSVPTITVRELESLKSTYLSQISSLKATLSGREAEVESLKRAVGDAERRVGEAQESLRDERNRREYAEQEKSGWEKRGQEVENVLKSVKEEVIKGETEREDIIRKMEDCERRAEDAEARAARAEERFADSLAARANSGDGDAAAMEEQVQRLVAAQIDAKIEAVSRELHAVYKEKHERKVATLKKSYEARGEKKCAELQQKLAELEKQNEDLIAAKDATFSGPVPDTTVVEVEAELKAQIEEQRAQVARLENEMQTSKQQQEQLMKELQQERIEKGDLVAAVDEMLALQSEQGPTQSAMSVVEDFRKSISRPSALRAPGGSISAPGESKIGKGPSGMSRNRNVGKSSLAANIERMGRSGSGASVD